MGTLWIPGATRIGNQSGGSMDTPDLPPRVVWHTVESPTGASYFRSMGDYLLGESVWPQVLYDPETDSLGQFCALNESGRALRNAGSVRTNRTGRVCIQIEVCGKASQPFTEQPTWRPGPNFRALMAAIRSWGIPDEFPAGRPQAYPGDHDDRDLDTWLNRGGHYGHSQIPGNDHGDPGRIDPAKLWAAAAGSPITTSPAPPAQPARRDEDDMWGYFPETIPADEAPHIYPVELSRQGSCVIALGPADPGTSGHVQVWVRRGGQWSGITNWSADEPGYALDADSGGDYRVALPDGADAVKVQTTVALRGFMIAKAV